MKKWVWLVLAPSLNFTLRMEHWMKINDGGNVYCYVYVCVYIYRWWLVQGLEGTDLSGWLGVAWGSTNRPPSTWPGWKGCGLFAVGPRWLSLIILWSSPSSDRPRGNWHYLYLSLSLPLFLQYTYVLYTPPPLAFLWLIPLPPLSLSLSSSFLPILPLSSSLLCLSFFLPPFNRSFRSKELYCHTFSLSLLSLLFFHLYLFSPSFCSIPISSLPPFLPSLPMYLQCTESEGGGGRGDGTRRNCCWSTNSLLLQRHWQQDPTGTDKSSTTQ